MTAAFLELPAFYIDAVLEDTLSLGAVPYYLVINRDPEAAAIEVPRNGLLAFDLAAESGDSPDLSTTVVTVTVTPIGGSPGTPIVAYDGSAGGFQVGWNGAGSATSVIDASTTRITIDPTTDFSSLDGVLLLVTGDSTNGEMLGGGAGETWAFTIEDVTAPVLTLATGRSKKVVRLTFDEPIVQTVASNANSSLNPSNYLITRQTLPAADVVIDSVSVIDSMTVDLEVDIEHTPGATYRVVVSNVEDLLGNVIAAPFDALDFTGFVPIVDQARDFQLLRFLPQKNRDEDASGDLRRLTGILQEVLDLLLCEIDRWTDILDPDVAEEQFLDCMLADLGNPFSFDLSEIDKRRLIRILTSIYKQKGTAVGIVNVVRFFLGIEVVVNAFSEEGWDLGIDELNGDLGIGELGIPPIILGPGTSFLLYSFEIVSPVVLTQEQRDRITDIANFMKPAHTHLVAIIEPVIPEVIDHLELGLSELGAGLDEWDLH